MKTFKTYLEERKLATLAALGLAGAAMAAPPKPEATQVMVDKMKEKEGFRPKAEIDKDVKGQKRVVVGYGTTDTYPDTGKPIKIGDTLTPEQGEQQIKAFFNKMTPQLEKIPDWDNMDAGKQAAIMSFAYNVGPGFYKSKGFETISGHLERKEWDKVPDALKLYNKAGGKVLGGLVKRREEEGKMWSEGLPTQTQKQEAPKTEPAAQKPTGDYEIKSGDTLSDIAKRHGKSLQDIIKSNPQIKDPNTIKPGQKVKVN